MPRTSRHIEQYAEEILRLKAEGKNESRKLEAMASGGKPRAGLSRCPTPSP